MLGDGTAPSDYRYSKAMSWKQCFHNPKGYDNPPDLDSEEDMLGVTIGPTHDSAVRLPHAEGRAATTVVRVAAARNERSVADPIGHSGQSIKTGAPSPEPPRTWLL
jgi:hypothetical protein